MDTNPKITRADIKAVATKAKSVFDALPLTEFKEPMSALSHEMSFGLAHFYSIEGCRTYIQNEINRAIRYSAINSASVTEMVYYKARAIALQELLTAGKRAYEHMEDLRKRAERQATA